MSELLESGIFDEGSSDYESFVLFASESSPTQSVFWVPRSEQEDTGNGFMIVVDAASPRIAPGTVLEPEVIGGIRAVAMHPADWEDRECYHWPEGWRMDLVELTSPRTRRAIPQEPANWWDRDPKEAAFYSSNPATPYLEFGDVASSYDWNVGTLQQAFWVPLAGGSEESLALPEVGAVVLVSPEFPRLAKGAALRAEKLDPFVGVLMHPEDWKRREEYAWPAGWRMDAVEVTTSRTLLPGESSPWAREADSEERLVGVPLVRNSSDPFPPSSAYIVISARFPRLASGAEVPSVREGKYQFCRMHPEDWLQREGYVWPGGFRMDLLFDPFRKQHDPPSKEEVARLLAFEHAEDSADTLAIFWLKTADEKTIWLIEIVSSVGGEEVLPFRFTPDPPDVPFHMGVILLPHWAWGEDILTARGESLNWPPGLDPATHEVELLFSRAPAPQET